VNGFVRNIVLAGAVAAGCVGFDLIAAAPSLTGVTPTALTPGKTTALNLSGENLDGAVDLWTSFPCEVTSTKSHTASFQLTLPKTPRAGIGAVRLVTTNGLSALQLLLIDALPGIASSLTNHTPASAQPLQRSLAIDGACEELRSDFFRISAKKGERIVIEAVAQRLGSPLDPLLRLLDTTGRELAFNDDALGRGADAKIDFHCPKTGDYFVELRDSRHTGGARHRYRLRFGEPLPALLPFLASKELLQLTKPTDSTPVLSEAEPTDSPNRAQAIPLPAQIHGSFARAGDRDVYRFEAGKGDRLVFNGRTRSLGSPCDLFLQLQTTNGTKIAEANATGGDEGALTNRFTEAGTCLLIVEELNRSDGPALNYQISAEVLRPGFTAATEADRVSGPAGDALELEVKIERREYDGPITLDAEGLPPGFKLENNLIAAKTNTTKVRIIAPPDSALGDHFPFSLVARATINDSPFAVRVSTMRAALPMLRHPPRELDGLITLGISESKSTNPKPPQKKRRN